MYYVVSRQYFSTGTPGPDAACSSLSCTGPAPAFDAHLEDRREGWQIV